MAGVDYDEQKDYWEGMGKRRKPHHPVVRAFAEPKLAFVEAALPAHEGRRSMLEIGAGNGYFSYAFEPRFELTALDFSQNMLDMNPLPAEQKVVGDAEDLQFDDASFDVVFCANLLHHLEDPIVAVREMARVARNHVVLIEPNSLNPLMALFGLVVPEERGSLKFTAGYLRRLGRQAGLRLRAFASHGAIVPNKTPRVLLPLLERIDGTSPVGFYHIGVFDV